MQFIEFLQTNPTLALFVIIAVGFIIGNIKIRGFSIDVSAVIFVALLLGHYGISVSPVVQSIGLVLFIFTVGIQAGPGFIDAFRQRGKKYILAATLLVVSSLFIATLVKYTIGMENGMLAGIVCGALTSTPGLSVAIEATGSSIASIGYGVAYPIGVLGVIFFIKLLPKMLRVSPEREFERLQAQHPQEAIEILHQDYRLENDALCGKSIREAALRSMTGCTVSRIQQRNEVYTPTGNTLLAKGDILRAVGTQEHLDQFQLLVGPKASIDIPLRSDYCVQSILVTNKAIVNQSMAKVQVMQGWRGVVTRIRRAGIDFSPRPTTTLKFGDKLTIACRRDDLPAVNCLIGNNTRALSDTDFLPIALGIVLGILLGYVQLSIGPNLNVSLGLTGGVLIMAIILSNMGKTGPILWTMSSSANNLLRQLGLLLFLCGVGTSAGANLVETITTNGILFLLVGALLTFVPMLAVVLINRWLFKLNLFELIGVLTGGMTSTPGLAAGESMAKDETPSTVYATVYPVAMVALIVAVKIIAIL